eukprot:5582935-Pyramimonas_sp.AAC.1
MWAKSEKRELADRFRYATNLSTHTHHTNRHPWIRGTCWYPSEGGRLRCLLNHNYFPLNAVSPSVTFQKKASLTEEDVIGETLGSERVNAQVQSDAESGDEQVDGEYCRTPRCDPGCGWHLLSSRTQVESDSGVRQWSQTLESDTGVRHWSQTL